jgi:hypothetical protein
MATVWFVVVVGIVAFVGGVIVDRKIFMKKKY